MPRKRQRTPEADDVNENERNQRSKRSEAEEQTSESDSSSDSYSGTSGDGPYSAQRRLARGLPEAVLAGAVQLHLLGDAAAQDSAAYSESIQSLRRIKKSEKLEKWAPLVPASVHPSEKGATAKLAPFGANFPRPEAAAKAADLALIAMWGCEAAAPHLNFPLQQYSPEVRRRYGHDLSSFLLSICEEGKAALKAAHVQRAHERRPEHLAARMKASEEGAARRRELQKVRKKESLVDEQQRCGVCPGCRQPAGGQGCLRISEARRLGYQANKVAQHILDTQGPVSSSEESSDSEGEAERPKKDGSGGKGKRGKGSKQAGKREVQQLEWVQKPRWGNATARKHHASRVSTARAREDAAAAEGFAADAATAAAALAASQPAGLAAAGPQHDMVPPPPHPALLRHAEDCIQMAAHLSLVPRDDPHLAGPFPPPGHGATGQCPLCRGWHAVNQYSAAECPMLQAALAVEKRPPDACPHCVDAPEPGCKRCIRGKLPAAVWTPAEARAPWAERIAPGTLGVMHSMQSMANAAISDYDRPDVAEKLGPQALLAMALVVEEVAAAQLRARR